MGSGEASPAGIASPKLKKSIGVELSTLRHELAVKYRARITDEEVRQRVQLVHDDILSQDTAQLLSEADVVYAANLHFPDDVNRRLGAHVANAVDPAKDVFVLALAPLHFTDRAPAAVWSISVPMSWNPTGWPVHCHRFPSVQSTSSAKNSLHSASRVVSCRFAREP